MSVTISVSCLLVVFFLCAAGIFSGHYRENWFQFFGLVLVGLWSAARAVIVTEYEVVPPQYLMLHIGMAFFASGTAYKVLVTRECEPQIATPKPLTRQEARNVAGGSREL